MTERAVNRETAEGALEAEAEVDLLDGGVVDLGVANLLLALVPFIPFNFFKPSGR